MSYQFDTSYPAFQEAKQNLGNKQKEVLQTITRLGICNDRMIGEALGWAINSVVPRRFELVEMNKIREIYKQKDIKTGRTTSFWVVAQISEQTKMF